MRRSAPFAVQLDQLLLAPTSLDFSALLVVLIATSIVTYSPFGSQLSSAQSTRCLPRRLAYTLALSSPSLINEVSFLGQSLLHYQFMVNPLWDSRFEH